MVLNKLEPGALARLGGGLGGGAVYISATNGKTTTARLLSACLRADGRDVTANAAGANLASGVTAALLARQRRHRAGSESTACGGIGVFEVDEGALSPIAGALQPACRGAHEPVPGPTRPLRRAGDHRGALGGVGPKPQPGAGDHPGAQRRRPGTGLPGRRPLEGGHVPAVPARGRTGSRRRGGVPAVPAPGAGTHRRGPERGAVRHRRPGRGTPRPAPRRRHGALRQLRRPAEPRPGDRGTPGALALRGLRAAAATATHQRPPGSTRRARPPGADDRRGERSRRRRPRTECRARRPAQRLQRDRGGGGRRRAGGAPRDRVLGASPACRRHSGERSR